MLSLIAVLMTVGVYGLVACIIKLDDIGLYLSLRTGDKLHERLGRASGRGIVWLAPWLMRFLSIAGTAAMFTVGGGILAHGIGPLHHVIESLAHGGAAREFFVPLLLNLLAGIAAGAILVGIAVAIKKFARPALARKG